MWVQKMSGKKNIFFVGLILLLFGLLTTPCVAVTKSIGNPAIKNDFDGDGQADLVIREPQSGNWYVVDASDNINVFRFGMQEGDIPVPGDYDGDGITDIAIRRPENSTWYILRSSVNKDEWTTTQTIRFGLKIDDIPVPGDYDGDGKTDVAVRRASDATWYIRNSSKTNFGSVRNDGIQRIRFGLNLEDIPVPADYDGDGITDIAVWRPSTGYWYIRNSSKTNFNSAKRDGIQRIRFGLESNDIPVPADYDGDGIDDIAVRRPSNGTWYIRNSSNTNYNSVELDGIQRVKFGTFSQDIPIPADYDGDGKADLAIRRVSTQTYYIQSSQTQKISSHYFPLKLRELLPTAPIFETIEHIQHVASRASQPPNVIIIFTDDQGYADLGVQGQVEDIKTPNIDNLAKNGVLFTDGYVTSPQCTPSRAAMVTGQYQQRFGVDENKFTPLPLETKTLGNRFKNLGYKTGLVGKWHLDIDNNSIEWGAANYPDSVPFKRSDVPLAVRKQFFPDSKGYDDTYFGFSGQYWTTFDQQGRSKKGSYVTNNAYRLDVVSDAATAFIHRNWQSPFYLHVAHYGPHVPLEATEKYLSRFSEDMPTRRRYALAMLAAIDDGVGDVVSQLEKYQLVNNTIIYVISDNGAPLGDDMEDEPITQYGTWDGSLNVPFIGEKGMLTEGGIRVPFIMSYPGHIDKGKVVRAPVSTLDAAYTSLKLAGEKALEELDGLDLMPAISGEYDNLNARPLFWRFYKQQAVRLGRWKYLKAGLAREYLFDVSSDRHEKDNLIYLYPEIANQLRVYFEEWSEKMLRPNEDEEIEVPFQRRYDNYLPND
ncbi:MAG: sulfatase-like hydrolase/transferase [Paraglaciecola sp.]|nr:sulfatase-like hydrolase/transferase [Paraglaciecola sp.]